MSRGFVREDDQEDTPIVPPRAALPAGVSNYVTPNGLSELKMEEESMSEELKSLIEESAESNRIQINFTTAKLRLLEERIRSAIVVDVANQVQNEVHFGAKITVYKESEKSEFQYQIVGVDEANISQNKVSFLSPIAKALRNKKLGDALILKTPQGSSSMKIVKIEY